jgi:hypothetical protein
MRQTGLLRAIGCVLCGAGGLIAAVVATTLPAGATPPPRTAHVRLATTIANRAAVVRTLEGELSRSSTLSAPNALVAEARLADEQVALTALASEATTAATPAARRALAAAVAGDTASYTVATAGASIALGASDLAAELSPATHQAERDAAALTALTRVVGLGAARAAAQQALVLLQQASSAVGGIADRVLAQTPGGYPRNEAVFHAAAATVRLASNELSTAQSDLTVAEDFLLGH